MSMFRDFEEAQSSICVHGAREHNLKISNLLIPRDQFVVITGVSGSGKSTLAFDLLFAEGQRRFLDSMNVYARQFVEQMAKPDVDLITGIPPTVSIEQRTSRGGGKSTVATVTEIYHFIRLLFARLGTQYCPDCQVAVEPQSRDALGLRLKTEARSRGDLLLLAPAVRNRKGFHTEVAEWAAKQGYAEVRADGKIFPTSERLRLDRFREHNVEIVTGVLPGSRKVRRKSLVSPSAEGLTGQELIDETLRLGSGTLLALDNFGHETVHSTARVCPRCARSFEALDPKHFSYNSPQGWCPRCRGFGELFYLPDVDRGARADAIEESWYEWQEGNREACPDCRGARLNPLARAVRLTGIQSRSGKQGPNPEAPTIELFSRMPVERALQWFGNARFSGRGAVIARDIMPEIHERLKFLDEVGLGYLELGRSVPTLSGGESQRIRLAAQLGSNLSGVLYILDEPTIGLHARDNEQLLAALQKLRSRGNSVLVVEHDEETMRRADYIIDLGPGAGIHGGQVIAAGTLKELLKHPDSITGACLRSRKRYPSRGARREVRPPKPEADSRWLTLHGASKNNLKNLTVSFPLGRFTVVTGVSGSGKSTLVRECLLPAVVDALKHRKRSRGRPPGAATLGNTSDPGGVVSGTDLLQAVYEVDQSPIGRTPRSIPATYVGLFDTVRQLFAQVPEARLRGYGPGRFSFNSAQGRCPGCEGAGAIKLEMNFLPPAFIRCEQCNGARFSPETLDVLYHGKNIAQVLDMSMEEALEFFGSVPKVRRAIQGLCDTGLGYLRLGQTSPTLSGGEAQRVKLVTHLLTGFKPAEALEGQERRNLFILEEPTIGLHMADVQRLVEVLQRLVDAGHTVVVIEHNLEVIAEADWVIDLGPEGGQAGGTIVAQGTPEKIATNKKSHTGRFLRGLVT
jgi:excinuclease ABC subunit A